MRIRIINPNGDFNMKVGQRGIARDGQHGTITEVYTNAVRFLSNSGAHFTLLNIEFFPSGSTQREVNAIYAKAKVMFSNINPGDVFHFRIKRGRGKWHKVIGGFIKNIPGSLGVSELQA